MAEFKIGLGIELDNSAKEQLNKIIDDLKTSNPPIPIDVDTSKALKKINTLQNKLNKLKDVKIKIYTDDANGKSNSSEVTRKYKEANQLIKQMSNIKNKMVNLDSTKNAKEIDELVQQLNRLKQKYDEIRDTFNNKFSIDMNNKLDNSYYDMNKMFDSKSTDRINVERNKKDFNELLRIGREIDGLEFNIAKLNTTDNANEISRLTKRLDELRQTYKELYIASQGNLSTEQMAILSEKAYQAKEKVEQLGNKLKDLQIKTATDIGDKIDSGKFATDISNIKNSMSELSVVSDTLSVNVKELDALLQTMGDNKANGNVEELINSYKEFDTLLDKVNNSLKQAKNEQKQSVNSDNLGFKKQKLSDDIDIWLKKNSAGAKEFGGTLRNVQSQIKSADSVKLNNLINQFKQVDRQAELAGKKGLSFADKLKQQWNNISGYFTLYDAYSYAKQTFTSMFNEVVNVDTAMSGLYRVTDLTTSQYNDMYSGLVSSAKEYGLVLNELIDGTTTWAKLGFDGQQASQLSEISGRYQVVADTDTQTAVTNLVTAYKGFQDELRNLYNGDEVKAVEYISDIFNKLGNEYAIDAESIGIALTKSASALNVAGNSIQESSGMITGITEVTGNAERAGKLMPEHIVIYGTTYVVWNYGKSVKS